LLKWRSAGFYDYDATWGSWSGSLTPVTTEPVDIAVTSLERLENGISVQYAASGPPMAAPDQLTPATDVRLYWASGPTPDAVLGDAYAFSLPVYWNLESATVELTDLTPPPPGTTHLLAIADRAGIVGEGDETNNVAALAISIVPQPDAYATDQDWPLDVGPDEGVLANDLGQEDATLTAILETAPTHGEFELYTDGSFTYTPDPDYAGIDRFFYRAADAGFTSQAVEVVIHVNPVLELPPAGKGYNLLLRRSGPKVQLVNAANPKQVFFAARDGDVSRLTVMAQDDKADTLTVDLSYGSLSLPDGVFFGGGFGDAGDSLVIRGTAASDVFTADIDAVDVNGIPVSFEDVERLTLDGGRGNDVYRFVDLGANTTLIDNKGTDLLDFSEALAGVTIDLGKSGGQAQRLFDLASDYTLGLRGLFENVNGSPEADVIKGNALANEIRGGDGDDMLYGNSGNDILHGGPGSDWLYGDAGNDKLYGGPGNNVLLGGAGNDRLDVREDAEAEDRNLLIGGAGIDALYGGLGEEILIGGTTRYDGKAAALTAVMEAWTSGDSFESRCGQLEGGFTDSMGTFVQLKPKTKTDRKGTVLDDGVRDTLFGDPASDWLFLFKKDQIGRE
jgi:Ca2+-binding RTX toxin-like protein